MLGNDQDGGIPPFNLGGNPPVNPGGTPPYNPGGSSRDDISHDTPDVLIPETPDLQTAADKATASLEAHKAALIADDMVGAEQHGLNAQRYTIDMLRHLRQEMVKSLADGEHGKTF